MNKRETRGLRKRTAEHLGAFAVPAQERIKWVTPLIGRCSLRHQIAEGRDYYELSVVRCYDERLSAYPAARFVVKANGELVGVLRSEISDGSPADFEKVGAAIELQLETGLWAPTPEDGPELEELLINGRMDYAHG